MDGLMGVMREAWRGVLRYGLPAAVVTAIVALPGAATPDEPETPSERSAPPQSSESDDDSPWRIRIDSDSEEDEAEAADDVDVIQVEAGPDDTGNGSDAPVVDALTASGIPSVALQAYRSAQSTMAVKKPGCGLRWSLLAAIGRVESNHGRFGGAQLRADGTGTKPIRGIPLDGRPGVATIRDTDGGQLDGDARYDRAVGPMQFIPSSWRFAGADGNGDGKKDPDNIFDAALATAGYLCAGDTDLRDPDQRAGAVWRYNHSAEYVRVVLALADEYERGQVPLPPTLPLPPGQPPSLPSPELPPATADPPLGWSSNRIDTSRGTGSTRPTTTTPGPTATGTTSTSTTTTTTTDPSTSTSTSTSTTSTTTSSTTTTACPTTTTAPSSTTSSTTTSSTTTTVPPGCPTTTTTTTSPTTEPSTTSTSSGSSGSSSTSSTDSTSSSSP
jgi:hypothetical protein